MDDVTVTPIYAAGWSKARVDVSHVHADDDHVPMREIRDEGGGISAAPDPTGSRYTVHECRRADCGVRVTTTLLHQTRLTELSGLVIEHADGRLEMYGEVPDDWRTNERQAIVT